MLFHTPEFLVFLLGLLTVLGIARRTTGRKAVLLVASYCFYMWWSPAFVLLIGFSTFIDYCVGGRIAGCLAAGGFGLCRSRLEKKDHSFIMK